MMHSEIAACREAHRIPRQVAGLAVGRRAVRLDQAVTGEQVRHPRRRPTIAMRHVRRRIDNPAQMPDNSTVADLFLVLMILALFALLGSFAIHVS